VADKNAARAEQKLHSEVLGGVAAALDARADLTANRVAAPLLTVLRETDRAATTAAQRSAWAEGLGQAVTVLGCSLAALWTGILAAGTVSGAAAPPELVAVIVLMQLALVEPYAGVVTAVRQAPALASVLQRAGAAGALERETQAGIEPTSPTGGAFSDGGKPDTSAALPHAGLRLEGIAARWPDGPTVFSNISAEAGPGRWLAVTGPSGSGKSTLLSVLLGFLPVTGGTVRLSGTAAWCPQEAHLFDSTIRGNLMLGRPAERKPSEGEMYKALADVGLDTLVETLPAKLDTRIGPGGVFLSGGERQRLAMARTLLTGARILLLDEPTAHLDAGSAAAMMAALRRGLKDVTVVLVTHNEADIDPADARLDLSARLEPPAGFTGCENTAELVGRPTRQ
jgi:ATP-binding cassette subfamily C protein CydCD